MKKPYAGFLNSHLAWSGARFGLTQFELPMSTIDLSAVPVVPTDRRLGHQAEFVYLQLLHASLELEVLAHSIQIVENKRTLGEIDFIIRNLNTSDVFHIEFTYKFYILDKNILNPIDQLVGPNRKDSFAAKIEKIKNKQLPLIYNDFCKSELESVGVSMNEIKQRVAFYSHIFLPYGDDCLGIEGLNDNCVAGFWVNREQFAVELFGEFEYYRPNKSEWLHMAHYKKDWVSYAEMVQEITHILDKNRSSMLWLRDENDIVSRMFVIV